MSDAPIVHFEQLWELCEAHYKKMNSHNSAQSILDELVMKINLYKIIDQKSEIDEIERKKIKSRLFGEILLTLTNLSLTDNVNVFESLLIAFNFHNI